jgi:FkbM family methyltransferase
LDGGIEPEEGAEALRRVLAVRPLPRLLIAARAPAALAAGVRDAARRLLAHARGGGARGPRSLAGVPYTPPRDAAEEAVAAIWRDVLRVEQVGAHDGFIALGGHSLLAIQVLSRLRASFGVEVPLRAFFAARTVAELARTVEGLIVAQLAAMSEEEAERAAGPPAADDSPRPAVPAGAADAGVAEAVAAHAVAANAVAVHAVAADAGAVHDVAAEAVAADGSAAHAVAVVAEPARVTLPNGMSILTFSRAEADHFYRDIFEHHGYLRHGVQLGDGACVLDVGANVGLFTLFVHARCRGATVYAFEPAPPAFELLCANTEALGSGVKRFPCGVAEERRQAALTFYPRSSGMSSFHADREQEGAVLRVLIHNARSSGAPGAPGAIDDPAMAELVARTEELIEERLAARSFLCQLVPLSEIIRQHAIPRIDLLKVDVQKSEIAVLRGIAAEDWPKIRQVAMEVHDLDGELAQARRLLGGLGYSVHVEQDELYRGSPLYNLYAVRP